PSKFTLRARDPQKSIVVGEDYIAFSPVAGPPFTYDLDRGRRESTMADFVNFLKLTHMTPFLHFGGGIISEPNDIPVPERHLDVAYAQAKYIDRSHMGSSISRDAANDAIHVARLVHGDAFDDGDPRLMIIVNVSSPRRLDERMLGSLIENARAGQVIVITPFILSGAMGPVSIAGTLAQLNAEALAGLAFVQMVNPGCPVIYGSFQAVIDLQSGAPVFGAPESQLSALVSIQLARRYGLPFRGSGMYTSSKVPDAQSAYESAMAMLPGLFSGTNYVLHAAGWLEAGLTAGYEKFILDSELLGMFHKYLSGIDFSEEAFAMDSIREVEPGGHHLGTAHTMANFRDAFYRAEIFDYNSAEQWLEEGGKDAVVRANTKFKQMLKAYELPALDPGIEEAIREYIERRRIDIQNNPQDAY
ncbi:MAG: trimethylamine methyltransferase family protein, partial [Chloroflexota bacterium]